MSKKEYMDLMEKFFDANQVLEVCQGYTQADVPNIMILSNVLFELTKRYTDLYLSLVTNNDYREVEKNDQDQNIL